MDERELKLSVVVISFNHRELLRRLIGELLDQDLESSRYEVIVVDDGSTDGSREWLKEQKDANLRVILGEDDKGRATSRNRGIRSATGNIVVMVDGDHSVGRDFLSIHYERHSAERCVIVGKSVFADDPHFHALNIYLNEGGAFKLPFHSRLPGRYFLTRNCSVPLDLLLNVGLFDESIRVWGGEDLDLGVRLEQSGVPIYGEPRALAVHHHFRPLDDLLKNLYIYGRDSIPLLLNIHPQLFEELNLHHVLPNPFRANRFSSFYRFLIRLSFMAPAYQAARMTAKSFMRVRLPRMLFDYLHLRQYARGYMQYVSSQRKKLSGRSY